jgi:predicted flavoprotein YhiN
VDSSGVITRAAGGLNVQAASASQNGYQNATQFGLTSSLGAMGSRATLTTTDATPETISLPALSTSSLRRVAVWVAVKNTSDLAKSLYREITFIARRGSSGNSVLVGSVVSGELADNNGSADPSGMGAISLAYTVGSGGSDSLTFTGIAATNLSTDYGLLISTI